METECIFCRIVQGKTSTKILFENENVVVFKDINPHAPIHLLIVPRKHVRSINELTDEDRTIVSDVVMVAKQMAEEVKISKSGYRISFNVERGGGQVIFHLHLHLIGGW